MTNDRSAWTFKQCLQCVARERGGHARGLATLARSTQASVTRARREHLVVAPDVLLRDEAGAAPRSTTSTVTVERVVQARRPQVVDRRSGGPRTPRRGRARAPASAKPSARSHSVRARSMNLQVVGVVDDAGGVGVLVVNAHREARRVASAGGRRLRRARLTGTGPAAAPRPGGARPKWRYASAVAMRPRGVRCRKPCWIRYGSSTSSIVSRSSPIAAARLSTPDRAAVELVEHRLQQLAVHRRRGRWRRRRASSAPRRRPSRVIAPSARDLGEVAHAAQQAVGDARRAARAARDLARAVVVDRDLRAARPSACTMRVSSSAV